MSFLSGGTNTNINYKPANLTGGAVNATFGGGGYNLGLSPQASTAVGNIQSTFQGQAGALGGLAATVKPGFSLFRAAGENAIETGRLANISNLRDTLAQRRILGSSFGNASISQANAEYDQQKANFEAQSYLEELDASNKLINEQYGAAVSGFQVGLNELNLETQVGANLTQTANSAMAQIAINQAQINQKNAAGLGSAIGAAAAIGLAPFTGGASLAALPALAAGSFGGGGGGGGGGPSYGSPSMTFSNPFSGMFSSPAQPQAYTATTGTTYG